jgi:excisionase family DNA binding protein
MIATTPMQFDDYIATVFAATRKGSHSWDRVFVRRDIPEPAQRNARQPAKMPYVYEYQDRHGKTQHKYRRGNVRKHLPQPYGSARFMQVYNEAEAEFATSVNKPRPENALLTIEEAAAILHVSPKLVRVFVREGSLRIVTLGQKGSRKPRILIKREDLGAFIEQRVTRNVPSCPSTNRNSRRSISTTSRAEAIGFTQRRLLKNKEEK